MNFNYETQGAITYLVCELDTADQLDSLTLGMLTNNHINGLAPVLYTEMDGCRFLKYNISAKVTANQFFSGSMNKERTLKAFMNILDALCSTDDYMIEQNCFSILPEHVFLNVSNCETALICIPVLNDKKVDMEIATFFKQILFSTQFDQNEDASYITQMISYLNSGSNFTVYGFRDLIKNTVNGDNAPKNSVTPQPQSASSVAQSVTPISAFDSTISINNIPTTANANQQHQMQNNTSLISQQPQMRRPIPVQPVQSQPQINQVKPIQSQVRKPTAFPSTQPQRVVPNDQQSMPKVPVSPVQQNQSFAIPGQNGPAMSKPQVLQNTKLNQSISQVNVENNVEKPMTFFNLMMHYNKENAALYKSQKAAKKSGQTAPKSKQANTPNVQLIAQQQNQQVPLPQTSFRPPQQPLPVQNSFNETTVLSAIGAETTVLNSNQMQTGPYLTRVKTGERIYINKPVFRIGKEKSYVDYFIADNTAISRSHCNIHTSGGEYFIEDTNSTNHTYINGNIINSNVKMKLTNGDKVRLANEEFTFSI